jgi:hypothetical protein
MSKANAVRRMGCLGCAGGEFRLCPKLKIVTSLELRLRTCPDDGRGESLDATLIDEEPV